MEMRMSFTVFMLLLLVGCNTGGSLYSAPSNASISQTSQPTLSSEPLSLADAESSAVPSEEIAIPDVIAKEISAEMLVNNFRSNAVSFNTSGAESSNLHFSFWGQHNNGFLLCQGDLELLTYDLMTKTIYMSTYWAYDARNAKFFSNDVVAIVGMHQNWNRDIDPADFASEHPLLLDKYFNPLPYQLQFDYGYCLDDNKEHYQYRILALTYDAEADKYYAVFASSALLDSPDGQYDNDRCEMGVAIFNGQGDQLERFNLPEITYSEYGPKNSSYTGPEILLTENIELIIVPSNFSELKYKGKQTLDPVCVNLDTRGTSLLTREEMETLLANSPKYKGKAFENGHVDYKWDIRERQSEPPFSMVEENGFTLVYLPDSEKAIFALPKKSELDFWTQTDDGMIHAIFIKSQNSSND